MKIYAVVESAGQGFSLEEYEVKETPQQLKAERRMRGYGYSLSINKNDRRIAYSPQAAAKKFLEQRQDIISSFRNRIECEEQLLAKATEDLKEYLS